MSGRPLLALHGLLFLLTIASASLVGAGFQASFDANQPAILLDRDLAYYEQVWRQPSLLWNGLTYSLTLLTILLAHEFGHYFACVYYRINASLPFFLPAPTFIGTLGAFIRIRQPIGSRRELFDIGVAGPIAGFIFVIPALLIGVSLSKVIPGIGHQGDLVFGTPPLLHYVQMLLFPGVSERDILLHPMARAGLVGLLATALNLLPVGQLDGGHIVYAFLPRAHRWISRGFVFLLLPLGFLWEGWFFWAALLFIFGLKHPPVYDLEDPGFPRRRVGLVALAIFLLCFTPTPVLP
ncbi:MAG: site-2 protease family protein [Bryobacterales bacterium]|nr:site-2 protease family protein [Bryobacterales bacterium]